MSVNAREEEYEYVELFGKPGLFTNARIDRDTVPEGWYAYDLRGSDYDPGEPVTVEPSVVVNHAGTILTHELISFPKEGFRRLKGKLDFADSYNLSLAEFCEVRGLNYPKDNRKYTLRPASPDEAGLFYTQEEQDKTLSTVGHLRFDHGSGGNEFWTTWWEHNGNELNTPEFKAELQSVVDDLRRGPLKDRSTMSGYCHSHAGELDAGAGGSYGYVVETENYRYCLRCTPRAGDYSYIYIYDKRQQELNMAQESPVVGKVSFANGEEISYTDASEYIAAVKEELPYHATSGFRYDGTNLAACVDDGWSVKVKLASERCPDGVWLRLPDYGDANDGKPDETRITLDELGVKTVDECTLLDAQCILPEIGNLMEQYDRISDLVYDGQNLGFVLDERGQGMENFTELYAGALQYEDCASLAEALDIAENLNRYDFVPMRDLREYARKELNNRGIELPPLAAGVFQYEEYAAQCLQENGFVLNTAENAYIGKTQSQRFADMFMQ